MASIKEEMLVDWTNTLIKNIDHHI